MAYGRGGAGNIQAAEEQTVRAATDLEANGGGANGQNASSGVDNAPNSEQQFAHVGRGGAGNYYSPTELNATGHFNDVDRSHVLGDGTLQPASTTDNNAPPSYTSAQPTTTPSRSYGRGGAGNYLFGTSESAEAAARKKAEEEQQQATLRANIEKAVEDHLPAPPKAKLSGAEPY